MSRIHDLFELCGTATWLHLSRIELRLKCGQAVLYAARDCRVVSAQLHMSRVGLHTARM